MNNVIQTILLSTLAAVIFLFFFFDNKVRDTNSFNSYYNTEGAFPGFIQKKNSLFRACEFSSNGSILSCSQWFDDDNLRQGQNTGIAQENI